MHWFIEVIKWSIWSLQMKYSRSSIEVFEVSYHFTLHYLYLGGGNWQFPVFYQNPNSTQPNKTTVGFDTKMTLHHHHTPPPIHRELNVSNISAVTDPIFTKLSKWVSGINNNNNCQHQQHQQKQQQQQQNISQLWLTKCCLNFKFRLGPTVTTTTKKQGAFAC